ncbi:hypothetical protein RQP46_002531 [Phenoliferia psychrophenolica]
MACASFSTLPLELKARIVEMANDQEDAWWLRVKDTAEDERVGHCIDSLNALALVNKELRQLAAKYQFKHLEADQAAPPIFRFTILPLYGHHIREITFYDDDSVEGCDNALSAMGQLPALDTIRLQRTKALELFGSLQTLYIKFFHLLASASTLSYLSFVHDDANVDPTDPALLSFLDSQPTLRDVNLEWFQVTDPFTPSGLIPQDPPFLAAYADLVHSRNLDPTVLDRPHLTPYHPDANLDHTRKEQPSLSQILRRTLEFGLVELDRMDAEGDVAEAVGWVPMLKPLEEKRLAWKD